MYQGCIKCCLYKQCLSPQISGRGNLEDPKLVLIGEAPGTNEDQEGEVFIGRAGELLTSMLGDKLPFVWITNAVRCCPYKDAFNKRAGIRPPTEFEMELCRPILLKELRAFDPKKVILMPMGAVAYYGLFGASPLGGITRASGIETTLDVNGVEYRVVPNIHPAYVLRNPEMKSKFLGVLQRAFEGEHGKIYKESDWKILRPEEGISKLEFILENKDKIGHVIIDLETTSYDPWHTDIIMVNFSHHLDYTAYSLPLKITNQVHHADYPYEVPLIDWEVTPEQFERIKELVVRIVKEIPLVGHNLKFDLKCLVLQGWIPDLSGVRILDDTMILIHLIYNQRLGNLKLKDCSKSLFDIRDDWDKKVSSYLERFKRVDDRTFGNIPTGILGEYGALDAFYNRRLHDHLLENMPEKVKHLREFMMSLVIPIAEAEIGGWTLDMEMYEFLFQKYGDMIMEISKKIRSLEPVQKYISSKLLVLDQENEKKRKKWSKEQLDEKALNIASPKQLGDIMYGPKFFNFPIISKTEKGASSTNFETLVALKRERLNDSQKDFINTLLDFRTINKLKTTYVDPVMGRVVDGKYKPDAIIPGTVTGRLCLTGDTRVSLLNGKEVRIDELPINEKVYLYGCKLDGDIIPVEAMSLGETKKVISIVEVILDNGETVKCTADHCFMLRDGTYKEAQFLTPEDSLMPLYRLYERLGDYDDYEFIINNKNSKKILTHKLVANYFLYKQKLEARRNTEDKYLVIHHKDFDRKNNDPSNLGWMGNHNHWVYHASLGKADLLLQYVQSDKARMDSSERLLKRWSDPKFRENQIKILRNNGIKSWESEERRKTQSEIGKETIKLLQIPEMRKKSIEASIPITSKRWKELWSTEEGRNNFIKIIKKNWDNEEYRNKMINIARNTIKKQRTDPGWVEKSRLAAIRCGTEVSNRIINKVCPKCEKVFVKQSSYSGHIGYCLNRVHQEQQSTKATNTLNRIINKPCPKCGKIFEKQAAYNGHIGNCKYNHRIVSLKIIDLEIPIPVYDLCSPVTNNFALSAGIFVHNSSGFHTLPRGSDIKRMYTSQWRSIGGLVLSADFSQLELRILAALSHEMKMVEAFIRGDDIHALTAGQIFQKAWNEVSKTERNIGKTTNFAIIYGKTAMTLKDDLGVTIQRAQEIIDNLLSGYDRVNKWMRERHREVMAKGSVETIFGRDIPIPERYIEKAHFQSEALRKAVNYPIQSTASDLVKSSLVRYYHKLKALKLRTMFLGEAHDALNNDLYPGEFFAVLRLLKESCEGENMELYNDWLICPVRVDVSLGTSMGSMIGFEIKELREDFVLLEGSGTKSDWEHLLEVGSRGYQMKLHIDEETPIDSKSYLIEQVIRDSMKWEGKLEISQK